MARIRKTNAQLKNKDGIFQILALGHYFWSSSVIALAYLLSVEYIKKSKDIFRLEYQLSTPFNNQDGQWYKSIVDSGYSYSVGHASNAAFFPLYPIFCQLVHIALGINVDEALVLVSNFFLIGSFLLLSHYTIIRFPSSNSQVYDYTMLAFATFPTTFFFRMGYSESCFVFLLLAYLILLRRNCNLLLLAAIGGLITAARVPGIALIPTTLLYLWRREVNPLARAWKSALILPLSCWGLLAYMGFQYHRFGDPLAFAHAQNFFKGRPTPPVLEKAFALLTLEPIRTLFNSDNSPLLKSATRLVFNLGSVDRKRSRPQSECPVYSFHQFKPDSSCELILY